MANPPGTPEEEQRWRKALAQLEQLLELPGDERQAALNAIVDPAQRALLETWLDEDAHAGGVLDASLATGHGRATPLRGRRFGRWRLEEEIGRGGMAVVWRAVSTEAPEGQSAAVKILSLGALARDDGIGRFVQEQRLLSRMRHPNIAALFDAGIAEDGTPWFAMALVDGIRIDTWCGQQGSDLRQRVALLLQVCDAVSYAHRSLVIHRDIKPSNVLVDENGHVRLMDFGIARLSDDATPERTATALRMLTPEYAAPEQFTSAPASTAMDVYGLGALLYRLLSGLPPRKGAPEAADPPTLPPSRAVRADAGRGEHEREQLARRLRGDLDTIVMTALAAQPEQRYASVDALAEDLRRWLDTRPIRARAPSMRYRLGRFVARNRWGVAAAAAAVLALGTGVAGIAWQGEQARRQAERAELTQQFLRDVFAEANPLQRGGKTADIVGVLRDASEQARERFATRPDMQVETLRLLGELQALNGDNTGALESLQVVHDLQLDIQDWSDTRRNDVLLLAAAQSALGQREAVQALLRRWLDDDRPATGIGPLHCKGYTWLAPTLRASEGRDLLEGVREACLALPADAHERLGFLVALSNARRGSGDAAGGMALVEPEIAALPSLASTSGAMFAERLRLVTEYAYGLRDQRRFDEAEPFVRDALAVAEARLGADSPLLAPLLRAYGMVLNNLRQPEPAREQMERALALVESNGEIQHAGLRAVLFHDLGVVASVGGDDAAAERYWRNAVQAYRDADMTHVSGHGALLGNLSYVLYARGAYDESIDMAQQALAFYDAHFPDRLDLKSSAEFNWCIAAANLGDATAIAHCERGIALDLQRLPDNLTLHGDGQQYLADAYSLLQQWEPALAAAERAIAILEPRFAADDPDAGQALYFAYHHRAEALGQLGRKAEGRRSISGPDYDDMGPPLRIQPLVQRARKAVGLPP